MSTRRPTEPRVAVRNASDPKQVKRAREIERVRLERERNELLAVWNTYDGRAVQHRRLARCGVFRLSFSRDTHQTAFNEGERNIGLEELALMTALAPELYTLMMQEHGEREALDVPESTEPTDSTEGTDPDGGN